MTAVRQPKVLLVDFNDAELDRVAEGLRGAGYRVVAIPREDAAIPLFRAFDPDILVMAARAPHFDAVQVVRRLRTLGAGSLPVFYIVDAPDPQLRVHCLTKGGGLDALARPLCVPELTAKINATLSWQANVSHSTRVALESSPLALHDPTSGLFNRAYFLSLIDYEKRRCARHGGSFTVVLGTIDVARSGGERHVSGRGLRGRALAKVSDLTAGVLREVDTLARVGPRSFGLLLPDLPEEHVPDVMGRLENCLGRFEMNLASGRVEVKTLLGSASFPDIIGTPSTYLARAQHAQRRAGLVRTGSDERAAS